MHIRRMPFSCYGSKFEFNAADRIALKNPMPRATGAGMGQFLISGNLLEF
jgi:hypothetical protein